MRITRRQFMAGAAAAMSAPYIFSRSALGADAPGASKDRLNVACVGLGRRIPGHLKGLTLRLKQNIVALCDVDETKIAAARQIIGDDGAKPKAYRDYRKLLESEKSLDAVIVSTPDHWHAAICTAAIRAGKHVFCEKPLAHSVAETRRLSELSRQAKVITQTGNQGSAAPTLRRSIEAIQAGVMGDIREVHVWHPSHGWPCGIDRPAGEDPAPAGLDWDFWVGPAPMRPYKDGMYHPIKWRGWYDFGGGSLADFCCHALNLPVRALKMGYPTKISISGTGMGKESFPASCTVRFEFPARQKLPAVTVFWYTGGEMPPERVTKDLPATFRKIPYLGCMLLGDKGDLSAGLWNDECTLKLKGEPKFRGVMNHEALKDIPHTLPQSDGQLDEWVSACLGGPKVFSDFDIGGHLTEIGLAGVVALRLNRDIEWDSQAMKVKGAPEAAALVDLPCRQKWQWSL